ncbi:carbohydrate ABC transporter substrate-binding protein [Neiella sp. HB171785]|uniref:Carbohydrate ABC transporter substrate-binding protein n=1 Tax=Neiella litorisoli TaxID=2771431 RepID=A0A8J6QU66_9GAMM|nr:ABC transporter substrate-binding protein [Neiella litorisoli]MBD1388618.1 carbohydrate ABC transporter substrate-binding protein [Neiella litorisoli]
MNRRRAKRLLLLPIITLIVLQAAEATPSSTQAIEYWLTQHFVHSTLSKEQQQAELKWFHQAAAPYRDLTIHVVSEDIPTHRYESQVLARAFYDLTGIHVIHEVTKEDDVVRKLQVQMELALPIYDAYVNDTDFIGTHSRYPETLAISAMMQNEWQHISLPTLDLDDFIGLQFATGIDGQLYQLPTQQFANLYWYRHDWFSDPQLQQRFQAHYGYPLGVPQNWAAYQDIANFFTNIVKTIDGQRVWGHMDYGHFDPSLGWRISDSWLSLAGANDILPDNGQPYAEQQGVGDWGIRVEHCHPVGASVSRGGALDSPAAIYAVESYISWLNQYAPPEARDLTFSTSSAYLGRGNIAQQIFWYTAFLPDLLTDQLLDSDGNPKWRVAPSPRGKYWQKGMKSGYQDVSGWTFLRSTPKHRAAAAWLYAQFVVSKTVSMTKFLNGFTPIRQSDIHSRYLTANSDKWGGLLEFYQSKARHYWTPTGLSVANYAALSDAWWRHIGPAVQGKQTVTDSMKQLANTVEQRLLAISKTDDLRCAPTLREAKPESYWLSQPGAPWPQQQAPDKPATLPYQQALQLWQD